MNIYERQKDYLSMIEQLDISPTQFKNAQDKYEALAVFLNEHDIEASIYPQGSFALGTVIRPIKKADSRSYDLDCICQVAGTKSDYTPSGLRLLIEQTLKSSNIYGGKLVKWEECFTIEYADISGVSFSIDLVPAVDDSNDNKNRLIAKGLNSHTANTSIVIPRQNTEKSYCWISNNPKGFKKWFDKINLPFLNYAKSQVTSRFYNQSSVEELPNEVTRSALQRVIQIMKYHRDTYYSNLMGGDDLKPISALITTIVAQIASNYSNTNCSVFELLAYVLDNLELCIHQKELPFQEFTSRYNTIPAIAYQNRKWCVQNPADPDDNLADKWNTDDRIPTTFFKWISTAKKDLTELISQNDDVQFGVFLENSFGVYEHNSAKIQKYKGSRTPTPINPSTASKPYRCL